MKRRFPGLKKRGLPVNIALALCRMPPEGGKGDSAVVGFDDSGKT